MEIRLHLRGSPERQTVCELASSWTRGEGSVTRRRGPGISPIRRSDAQSSPATTRSKPATIRATPVPQWNGVVDCKVLVVEPYERLSYSWNASGRA
jgi:hypothetical protein